MRDFENRADGKARSTYAGTGLMSAANGSPELDLELVGGRPYVRATDVLAALIRISPSKKIAIRFDKPLRGPAMLVRGHHSAARATARLDDGDRYSLVPLHRKAKRVSKRPRPFRAFCLRLGMFFLVFTGPGSTVVGRIDTCSDLGFARLPQRYFVRTLIFHGSRAKPWGLLWYRIRRNGSEARCVMRTLNGPLIEFHFFVRRRSRPD